MKEKPLLIKLTRREASVLVRSFRQVAMDEDWDGKTTRPPMLTHGDGDCREAILNHLLGQLDRDKSSPPAARRLSDI